MSKSVITMGQGLARVTPRVEVSSQLVRRTDAAEDRACGDDQGAREVHLAGAASTGEVPVLGAHGDLGGRVARSGARLDAGATRRIDELGPRALEDLGVPLVFGVPADVLRAELQVEVHARRHTLALGDRGPQDLGVHVHVGLLAARARPAVRDVDLHVAPELVESHAVAWVTRRG